MSRAEMFKHGKNMADRWLQRHESTIKAQQWIELQKRGLEWKQY